MHPFASLPIMIITVLFVLIVLVFFMLIKKRIFRRLEIFFYFFLLFFFFFFAGWGLVRPKWITKAVNGIRLCTRTKWSTSSHSFSQVMLRIICTSIILVNKHRVVYKKILLQYTCFLKFNDAFKISLGLFFLKSQILLPIWTIIFDILQVSHITICKPIIYR